VFRAERDWYFIAEQPAPAQQLEAALCAEPIFSCGTGGGQQRAGAHIIFFSSLLLSSLELSDTKVYEP